MIVWTIRCCSPPSGMYGLTPYEKGFPAARRMFTEVGVTIRMAGSPAAYRFVGGMP
jgi:hypothetical protein